jgi:hypothetical protein
MEHRIGRFARLASGTLDGGSMPLWFRVRISEILLHVK